VSDNQSVSDRSNQSWREYGTAQDYAQQDDYDIRQADPVRGAYPAPQQRRQSFQGMNWNYARPSSDSNSTLTISPSSYSAADGILAIFREQGLEHADVVELLLQGEEGHIAALNLLETRYGYAQTSAPMRPYGYNRGDIPEDVRTKICRIYEFFGMEDVSTALSVFAGKELRLLNVLEKKWSLPITSFPLGYNSPEEMASMDIESKIRSIHHHYRLPDENATLAMYDGQELRLLNVLEKKYGLPITPPPEEEQDYYDDPSSFPTNKRGKPSRRRSINKALAAKGGKKKDNWKYTKAAAGGMAKGAVIGAATGVLKGIFYSPLTTICCGGTNLIHRAAIGASVGAVKGTAKAVIDTAAKNNVYGFKTLKSGMKAYHKAKGGFEMFEGGLSRLAGDNSDNDSVDPASALEDKARDAIRGKAMAAVKPKKGSKR